jgi:hypothetical protein
LNSPRFGYTCAAPFLAKAPKEGHIGDENAFSQIDDDQ